MKGINYFNWFSEHHKLKWLDNFYEQKLQNLESFMERDFPHYFTFLYISFDIDKSKEGMEYWVGVYNSYKKYDNLNVKPGFGKFDLLNEPKTFKIN